MNTIETIRAEIERLKAKYRKDMYKSNHEGLASGYKIEAYNELLSFLDTLEEEPVEVKFKPGMKNVLDALRPCNSEKPNTPEGLDEAVKWLVDDDYDPEFDKGRFILGSVGLGYNGYYIPYSDLLKLPKED